MREDRDLDSETVEGFGREWETFNYFDRDPRSYRDEFDSYFRIFPWSSLPEDAQGFDVGCGTGRWARFVAPRVGRLHCIDPAARALRVARRNLAGCSNCQFYQSAASHIPLPDASMDFGYALGVLHHVPDPGAGLRECADKLKPGAPFLVYMYYALENRPVWYQLLWKATDVLRSGISRLPFELKRRVTDLIAASIYWPLARTSAFLERLRMDVSSMPLSWYRSRPFYSMRNDALDRFGTRLERRFTLEETRRMMGSAGFVDIRASDEPPYWCVVGRKPSA